MTLVGTPGRPEVLAPAPPSILDARSGLPCVETIMGQTSNGRDAWHATEEGQETQ